MKLIKVDFIAFKSLLNHQVEINKKCIGFVGANESGKSNILLGISKLSGRNRLDISESPKMGRKAIEPHIAFELILSDNECKNFTKSLANYFSGKILGEVDIEVTSLRLKYHVFLKKGIEYREFRVDHVELNQPFYFVKKLYINDVSPIYYSNAFTQIRESGQVLSEDAYHINSRITIGSNNNELKETKNKLTINFGDTESTAHGVNSVESMEVEIGDGPIGVKNATPDNNKLKINKNNEPTDAEISRTFHSMRMGWDIPGSIQDLDKKITNISISLDKIKASHSDFNSDKSDNEKSAYENKIKGLNNTINSLNNSRDSLVKQKDYFKLPISEKYQRCPENLTILIKDTPNIKNSLTELLPSVIFWKYSEENILPSEIPLEQVIDARSENDIPRPLYNIFTFYDDVNSIEDIKTLLRNCRETSAERSRASSIISSEVNTFIKKAWPEFGHEIRVVIEKSDVTIQICSSSSGDHHYFSMSERSQGAKSFLSFLLAIAMEANNGGLENSILLLDEPETHLHPASIRGFLNNLIGISENINMLLYATHSSYMIHKGDYSSHFIVKKENGKTSSEISSSNRVGHFIQEEVLYGSIGIELNNEIAGNTVYNYVFEGLGDLLLFRKFYSLFATDDIYPGLDDISFFHGGGCGKIQRFVANRPLRLGSKWWFLLDSDKPAVELNKMISSKYNKYIGNEVLISMYESDGTANTELEDILPFDFLLDVLKETCIKFDSKFPEEIDSFKDWASLKGKIKDINKKVNKKVISFEFKSTLNKNIEDKLNSISSCQDFKDHFNMYCEWAESALVDFNNLLEANNN